MSKGFTLVELLVVTAIIVLMTALILPNYRTSDKQLVLQRATYKLAQDLRRTQEMAMSAKEFQGQVPPRYGIEFGKDRNYYILFADMNIPDGNGKYEPPGPDIEVERITLEKGVMVQDLLTPLSKTTVWVAFKPPDPLTTIRDPGEDRAILRIKLTNADNQIKIVSVNNVGLIAIE